MDPLPIDQPLPPSAPSRIAGVPADVPGGLHPAWDFPALAGRLVELSARPGSDRAGLTMAADLLWRAQQQGEPAAWVGARASTFFPPDLHASGIDLDALPVVRTTSAGAAARAAERLLRSGAFGLVLVDLGPRDVLPPAPAGRLLGLARLHRAAVVLLTEKADEAPSLAPGVSLRLVTSRRRSGPDRFTCTSLALKDRIRGPGWSREETFRGPPGLR